LAAGFLAAGFAAAGFAFGDLVAFAAGLAAGAFFAAGFAFGDLVAAALAGLAAGFFGAALVDLVDFVAISFGSYELKRAPWGNQSGLSLFGTRARDAAQFRDTGRRIHSLQPEVTFYERGEL
jgi:hypothetical protein